MHGRLEVRRANEGVGVSREDNDFGGGIRHDQLAGNSHPIPIRQLKIEDQKVRPVLFALGYTIGCGGAGGHHLYIWVGSQNALQELKEHFLIFNQYYF
jgi:hypothetical protein